VIRPTEQVRTISGELGFDVVGITSVDRLIQDDERYQNWREAGYHAGMEYMARRPELFADPRALAPYAKSIITLAINYYSEAPEFRHENLYGRIARYAWGRDYHDVVKTRLLRLSARIEELAGKRIRSRCFVDAVPLLERAVAERAGLGFAGKNTNLIRPRSGSWFFLAEILTELELTPTLDVVSVSCGTCSRCIGACPTAAFPAAHTLDSNKCISYLTIENKGEIPRELRPQLGEWIFGCDVCQDVCPFNRFSAETAWPELTGNSGTGQRLNLIELLSIATNEQFRARFRGTPLMRPRRRGLLRNAAVVSANVDCVAAIPVLIERVRHDPEPLIRSHALWALGKLGARGAAEIADSVRRSDPAPEVRLEAELFEA